MPQTVEAVGLLLKLRGNRASGFAAGTDDLARRGDVLMEVPAQAAGLGLGAAPPATWVRIAASDNPWDELHALARRGFGVDGGDLLSAEPDIAHRYDEAEDRPPGCTPIGQQKGQKRPVGPGDNWHLSPEFSDLAAAREAVSAADLARIRIAHLDTGYDPGVTAKPANILHDLERSFVKGDPDPNSAVDRTPEGGVLRNGGHGPFTLGLLAAPGIGGAPGASIIPIRVAQGVVRFTTSTIVQGFNHARKAGAQLLSMSMGGLASGAFADAVNACYDDGMVMVTAAGNNFGGLPIGSIVYPARFRRVVAACGIMADLKPYSGLPPTIMSGSHGPGSKMATALAAFTPNVPRVRRGCENCIDHDGQGTSAATPQIAAAAALWLAKYGDRLALYPQAWMRGEAARQALFRSAALGGQAAPDSKLGWGALRAMALLAEAPMAAASLKAEARASASWALLKLLTGKGVGLAGGWGVSEPLLELEILQLAQQDPALAALLPDPEAGVDEKAARRFLEAVRELPQASRTLRREIGERLAGVPQAPAALPKPPRPTGAAPATAPRLVADAPPRPARRRLRIFALDPTLGGELNSYEQQVATVEIRNEIDLKPGPVGEYLEVVDIDPATDRIYPPVDLNHLDLALADGYAPSEGNPRFHQQMVYAVAMRTIETFEVALGRKALWAGIGGKYVQRLRVHPHALRAENAYYSPAKVALLFGYFPARAQVTDLTPAGTMIFTCLSSDIITHEVTHALLDGQSQGFRDPSNPDVLAFHEGFADIIALFQQFTYTDLVAHEIGRGRGALSAARLLGGLARQFGRGTGKAGPLRSYPDLPDGVSYPETGAVHDRGAILVSAIYRAFLAIVERRTQKLIQLATNGTGVLPEGRLHPDLVSALAAETCKAAQHVLTMCIRALDYCPPVDISYGEYLRALVTADLDCWPDDRSGYRVAFLEAFRRYGMLPRDLRTISPETLVWQAPGDPRPAWLADAVAAMEYRPGPVRGRAEIHALAEMRARRFADHLRAAKLSPAELEALGLQTGLPRHDKAMAPIAGTADPTNLYVDGVRIWRRQRPDGEIDHAILARIRQRRPEPLDPAQPDGEKFWFRGGATIIIDPFALDADRQVSPKIRYIIYKRMTSEARLERERAFRTGDGGGNLRAAYFGGEASAAFAEPFALLHASRETGS